LTDNFSSVTTVGSNPRVLFVLKQRPTIVRICSLHS